MAASQRVSRGFHRLAVFLAAIPLVVGILGSIFIALDEANAAKRSQDEQLELICAQELAKAPTRRLLKPDEVIPLPPGKGPADVEWHNPPPDGLKAITYPEAKNPFDQFDEKYDLKELGCSEQSRKVSWHDMTDAPAPGVLNYAAALLPFLSYGFGISLGIAFALYGIVRAIGSPPTSESRFCAAISPRWMRFLKRLTQMNLVPDHPIKS